MSDGQLIGLEDLFAGSYGSIARAVSADGKVIVGYSFGPPSAPIRAFRWTEAEGMIDLGDLTGGGARSWGLAVNADGTVVVGRTYNADGKEVAYRWTEADGMVDLSDPDDVFANCAYGVSADGKVIVGYGTNKDGKQEAFRWTEREGKAVGLGDLDGGDFHSFANAVSADGKVVVGYSASSKGEEAFRWTEATGKMEGLGILSGHERSEALAVNADGSVIVGISGSGHRDNYPAYRAFIWTQATGIKALSEFLGEKVSIWEAGSCVMRPASVPMARSSLALVWTRTAKRIATSQN